MAKTMNKESVKSGYGERHHIGFNTVVVPFSVFSSCIPHNKQKT
jgi:hypothetical protein